MTTYNLASHHKNLKPFRQTKALLLESQNEKNRSSIVVNRRISVKRHRQ